MVPPRQLLLRWTRARRVRMAAVGAAVRALVALASLAIGWLGGKSELRQVECPAVAVEVKHECTCDCRLEVLGSLQISQETRLIATGAGGVVAAWVLLQLLQLLVRLAGAAAAGRATPIQRPTTLPAVAR